MVGKLMTNSYWLCPWDGDIGKVEFDCYTVDTAVYDVYGMNYVKEKWTSYHHCEEYQKFKYQSMVIYLYWY